MLDLPETGPLPSPRLFRYVTPETLELIRRTVNTLVRRGESWEEPCRIRHCVTNEIIEVEGASPFPAAPEANIYASGSWNGFGTTPTT